ncbi:MAG: hypothetical protein F6J98_45405, partial [Moorea sp. SIO4G2]|nr:hypothetical protein [Moorena sp. SIO4G2]
PTELAAAMLLRIDDLGVTWSESPSDDAQLDVTGLDGCDLTAVLFDSDGNVAEVDSPAFNEDVVDDSSRPNFPQ